MFANKKMTEVLMKSFTMMNSLGTVSTFYQTLFKTIRLD